MMTKEDEESFKKCITKVTEWSAPAIYFFYEELHERAAAVGIWVLPWPHFRRGITNHGTAV